VRRRTQRPASLHFIYDVLGLALIALIVLKLSKVVTWSWWWVLIPLWINLALGFLVLGAWALAILGLRRELRRSFAWRMKVLRDRLADETAREA